MKTILYATDYSDNSVAAMHLAHNLATRLDAQLVVMHIFDMPISLSSPVTLSYLKKEERLLVEHREKLATFCTLHLGKLWQEGKTKLVVREHNSVKDGILEKLVEYQIDLLVLGAKGASAMKEFFLGSTTEALIGSAPCAVLSVPDTFKSDSLKNIVYATDFEQADLFAINRLVKIAEAYDASVKVFHVTTKKEYAGDQQMEWFKDLLLQKVQYGRLEFVLRYSDNILDSLQGYLEESKADVLVMLEREDRGIYRKLFHRDFVVRMESKIDIPLMSFNVAGM
jgi:nucleotide-binding universal stress UspA family protein